MNWLDIDFVKCDKTESKSLVVTLEPHWSPAVSKGMYDVKLPSHYPNLNEIIFSKDHYDGVIVEPSSGAFVFRKNAYIKTLYLDLETLFNADAVGFDLPSNEDITLHYQSKVILVSPIEHKEFHVINADSQTFQLFISAIYHLYHHADGTNDNIRPLWKTIDIQSEILSNFSEEEIKAMDIETSPLYLPIVVECIQNYFNTFVELIYLTNNKETLNRILTDERSSRELSGEAKAIIIKRMAELEDERSFEL